MRRYLALTSAHAVPALTCDALATYSHLTHILFENIESAASTTHLSDNWLADPGIGQGLRRSPQPPETSSHTGERCTLSRKRITGPKERPWPDSLLPDVALRAQAAHVRRLVRTGSGNTTRCLNASSSNPVRNTRDPISCTGRGTPLSTFRCCYAAARSPDA